MLKIIKKWSRKTKIQLVIALVLTVALIVAVPTYSWFNYERKVAELAKIKSPDNLYINAAHKEDVIYLDMSTIDVSQKIPNTETPITSQSFVFSVSGEWVNHFSLQIEHTTNNPYTYTFYEGTIYASEPDLAAAHPNYQTRNSDGSLNYVEYVATNVYDSEELSKIQGWPNYPANDVVSIQTGNTYYIWIGDAITNKDGNQGSYVTASAALEQKSYETGTHREDHVVPRYWQLDKIETGGAKNVPFYKTYVIKASWTGVSNISDFNKETDLFYISAFVR